MGQLESRELMSVSMAPGASQAFTDGMLHRGWDRDGDGDREDGLAWGRLWPHTPGLGDPAFQPWRRLSSETIKLGVNCLPKVGP